MNNFLLDSWQVSGNTIPEFSTAIADARRFTHIVKRNLSDFKVLSRIDDPDYPDCFVFYYLDGGSIKSLRENGSIPKKRMKKADVVKSACVTEDFEQFFTENELTTRLMLIDGQNRLYFVSQGALATLSARIKCAGEWFFNPSLSRDISIAEVMCSSLDNVTVNYCEVGGVRKILSFCTEKYGEVPLTILTDIISRIAEEQKDKIGTVECKWWNLTHRFAEVYVEFPDAAADIKTVYGLPDEIVPGLYLASSDTADSSLFIRSTYRRKNGFSYITTDEVQVIHKGEIAIDKVMETVDNRIFSRFLKFPEQLASLIVKEVTPSYLDLSTDDGQARNKNTVFEFIKDVFKSVGMVAAISKKNEKILLEQISYEINPSIPYTQYDIATMIIDLPERLEGLDRKRATVFRKACAYAIPAMATGKLASKQGEILLTA